MIVTDAKYLGPIFIYFEGRTTVEWNRVWHRIGLSFQGEDSEWSTDEDQAYDYVIDEIEPPSSEGAQTKPSFSPTLRVTVPTEPMSIRPPRTKHKSPTAVNSPSTLGNYQFTAPVSR